MILRGTAEGGRVEDTTHGNWVALLQDRSVFMNNRQTSRRRGRGNNRAQNANRNGYDHQNRIDNRARGNAAQMLEKYKKLAQDAQLNGDRVQAEYYHQFADHYFRVLADFRSRQEENRPQRSEWRNDDREGGEWREDERDAETGDDESGDAEISGDEGDEGEAREDRRPPRIDRRERTDRNERGNRNRRDRNDRYERSERPQQREDGETAASGLDLAVLPPAIGPANDEADAVIEAKPARKPRTRKPKPAEDETVAAE